MYSIAATAGHPQLHSHDQRVRLREAALFAIVLEHLCSMQDFGVLDGSQPSHRAAHSAGITEWQGRWSGRPVSLGWDWLRLHDGALVPETTVGPRSNVMLIDARGYDMSPCDVDAALWRLIRALPWQAQVAGALAAEVAI